jgi:hypothetical protein
LSASPGPSKEAVVNRIDSDSLRASRDLSSAETQEVRELRQEEQELRLHELAYIARSMGPLRRSFTFVRGADNKQYAVAGPLRADLTPVPGDLEATVDKMKGIKQAALSSGKPKARDALLAGQAAARERSAEHEIVQRERLEPIETIPVETAPVVERAADMEETRTREQDERLPRGTGGFGNGKDVEVDEFNPEASLRGTASVESGPKTPAENAGGAPIGMGSSSNRGTDSLLAGDVEEGPLPETVAAFDESHFDTADAEVVSAPQEANELAARVQERYYPGSGEGGILTTTV